MRPIRLTFSGLRSYRSQAVVDFEGLELFAIVGDTGAGKSTIIEALSLALYATKTWQGGAAKSEMIADGESTMAIELVFDADGHRWTVTRSWRRSGPGVNRLERADKAEKVDGSTAVTERVTQLLGLTHAQFTQAVVMPQGRFDKLLQATPSDRNRLLASILGLDAVRQVGTEAARLRDEWQPTLDLATARRQVLPLDPAAELAAAERELIRADDRLGQLRAAVDALADHEVRVAALARAQDRLRRSLAAVPTSDRDPIAELEDARAVGERLGERRRALVAEQRDLDAAFERLDQTATKTLAGFARRDDALEARTTVRAAAHGLRVDVEALDSARGALARVEAAPPPPGIDDALTAALAAATTAAEQARTRLADAEAAVRRAEGCWADLVIARAAHAAALVARTDADARLTSASAQAATTAAAREEAAADLLVAQAAEADALAADAAAAVASGCEPGDDCPVCRRPLPADFAPPPAGALAAARARAAAARASADAARDAASVASRDEEHARTAAEQAVERAAEAETAALLAERASADAGCDLAATDAPSAVARVRADRDAASDAASAAEQANQRAADAVAAATATASTAAALHAAARANAQAAVEAAERRVAAHLQLTSRLPEGWVPAEPITAAALDQVADDLDTMLDALAAIDEERSTVEATRAAVGAAITEIETEARHEVTRSAESALAVLNERFGRLRDAVRAAAEAPPPEPSGPGADARTGSGSGAREDTGPDIGSDVGPDVGLVEPVDLPTSARTAELPDIIAAARAAITAADAALDAVRATAARVDHDHDLVAGRLAATLAEAGCASLAELHTEAGRAGERAAAAAALVVSATEAVAAADQLDAFLAEARPFVASLTVLAVALRDQHFVGHLVKAREVELIAEANRRLRAITTGRFGFVRDFGVVSVASGEIRSPDALSGGERFQAALALALSLVEIASRGGGRLDAVFVDEGFGSLDTAALDSALDTLGKVASGGKMVGLISHLKPVAEYVESVMLVRKSDVLGSTITLLDPDGRERLLADDIRSGLTGH